MIEALLDVMKWPSWILHLSDCETGSTIAAIIVLGPRPIFHCTSSTVLLWLPRTSQWTCGFGFSLLRMWAFHSTHSNSRRVNWPPQSLGRFTASWRGRRRLPGSRGSGPRGHGRGDFWPLRRARRLRLSRRQQMQIFQRSYHLLKWGRDPDVYSVFRKGSGPVAQTGRGRGRPIWLTLLISFRRQTKQTVEQYKEKTERLSSGLQEAAATSSKSSLAIKKSIKLEW